MDLEGRDLYRESLCCYWVHHAITQVIEDLKQVRIYLKLGLTTNYSCSAAHFARQTGPKSPSSTWHNGRQVVSRIVAPFSIEASSLTFRALQGQSTGTNSVRLVRSTLLLTAILSHHRRTRPAASWVCNSWKPSSFLTTCSANIARTRALTIVSD